ncbi:unnamed protein product [Cyprideis torosa]|uniref:Uncharacterized protein n=1 Tax=Cyprideis torosa TaxID=163714 RepID=A0A7R8ZTJ2_9CRUS|nr:unnamed protein product [Cyprideis torosa]CAG0907670.1 unnamed protein product [Cyprideis torosa]
MEGAGEWGLEGADPLSRAAAAWYLFDPIAEALGPQKAQEEFLGHLTSIFEQQKGDKKCLKLYHRTYLLQLIARFGTEVFMETFVPLLVAAVTEINDFEESTRDTEDVDQESRSKESPVKSHPGRPPSPRIPGGPVDYDTSVIKPKRKKKKKSCSQSSEGSKELENVAEERNTTDDRSTTDASSCDEESGGSRDVMRSQVGHEM